MTLTDRRSSGPRQTALTGRLLVEGAVSKDSLCEEAQKSLSESPTWTETVNQTPAAPPPGRLAPPVFTSLYHQTSNDCLQSSSQSSTAPIEPHKETSSIHRPRQASVENPNDLILPSISFYYL